MLLQVLSLQVAAALPTIVVTIAFYVRFQYYLVPVLLRGERIRGNSMSIDRHGVTQGLVPSRRWSTPNARHHGGKSRGRRAASDSDAGGGAADSEAPDLPQPAAVDAVDVGVVDDEAEASDAQASRPWADRAGAVVAGEEDSSDAASETDRLV